MAVIMMHGVCRMLWLCCVCLSWQVTHKLCVKCTRDPKPWHVELQRSRCQKSHDLDMKSLARPSLVGWLSPAAPRSLLLPGLNQQASSSLRALRLRNSPSSWCCLKVDTDLKFDSTQPHPGAICCLASDHPRSITR